MRHRKVDGAHAALGRNRSDAPAQPHGGLWAPDDLDLLPRERARDAEPERLADRFLAGEATRVALGGIRTRVAVRLLGFGEAAVAEPGVPRERAANARDLDQIGADTDHRRNAIGTDGPRYAPGEMPRPRTAADYLDAFGGSIWGPEEGVDGWSISGSGSSAQGLTHLGIRRTPAESDRSLEIDTRRLPAFPRWLGLHGLISHGTHETLLRPRLRFPLEIRVEKERTTIRLDGRTKRVDLYSCGTTGLIHIDMGDGLSVQALGALELFEGLAIRKLSEHEVAALVREHQESSQVLFEPLG
jgi:hypothetical protein